MGAPALILRFKAGGQVEIPLLASPLHLLGEAEDQGALSVTGGSPPIRDLSRPTPSALLQCGGDGTPGRRSDPRTVSGGEFDWGGTSVKG